MRQEGEPSVEEILDSIKKVIARDNRAEADEKRSNRESAAMLDNDDNDTIEEEVLDLLVEAELAEDRAHEAAVRDEPVTDGPLLTEAARSSMQESFAALAMLSEPSARPQIVRSGETSLEGMVQELLRPALAEWLETNLPEIVERLVAAEISRIAGKRG